MVETHQAEIDRDGSKTVVTLTDPTPLRSAKLFRFVSDKVWEQRPDNDRWAMFGIEAAMPAPEALTAINKVIGAIDEKLVIAGGSKDLNIGGGRGERARISKKTLAAPEAAYLETYNWDSRWNGRSVKIDGERHYAEFTDGHLDYARELSAGFVFSPKGNRLAVSYGMQRYQYGQAEPTRIFSHVWYSRFAETGYEGNAQHFTELTVAQETDVLKVFADIGGISTKGYTKS